MVIQFTQKITLPKLLLMHLKVFLLSLSLHKIRLSTTTVKPKVLAFKQRMCLTSCFQPEFMKIAINTPIVNKKLQ